jgi:TonB family protein
VPNTQVSKGLEPPLEEGAPQISVNDAPAGSDPSERVSPSNESLSAPSSPREAQEKSQLQAGTVSVSWSTYPAIRVPPELRSEASSSGASLQIGELISRVDPIYPEEAERQAVEGTVRLRAIVGKDGAVADIEVVNGPPLLSSAAVSAVRQWRYKPTLVGDQPVEVAEEITISFRLPGAASAPN